MLFAVEQLADCFTQQFWFSSRAFLVAVDAKLGRKRLFMSDHNRMRDFLCYNFMLYLHKLLATVIFHKYTLL